MFLALVTENQGLCQHGTFVKNREMKLTTKHLGTVRILLVLFHCKRGTKPERGEKKPASWV